MLFYIVFFSLYAFMHFYFIYKLKRAFNIRVLKLYLISPLFIFSPYFYRMYDKVGYDLYYLSLFILVCMGFIMLFFIYYILIDFYHFLIRVFYKIFGINPLPSIRNNISFVFVLLLTISSLAYGYYETLNPKIYRFVIYSDKIKKDIKILHISDLHLNQVMREDKIKLVLDVYNKEKPDIVISTGDLVDGKVSYRKSYVELLKNMNPPLGKYAILGNHEYYTDINDAVKFHLLSGFQLLRNETTSIDKVNVAIIGVDDIDGVRLGYIAEYPEKDLFKGLDKTKFVIFLKHQPKLDKTLVGEFDLMLSGHTHGGVLFPVRYILRKIFIADFGLVNIGSSYIFVSRGVGTGGPPIRIGCPPDVAIFEIKKLPR
ncbi:metallophosphoesterase [Sulfurihydrogenibium azorense]|uniref:metallophosphoesterase n=1 Tax=Sulfurihydrogenibium azorense TaxID=309806 RepID=UPI002409AEFC|nr:metallophosphoesterase [Sulfurihydrogenibium azorense]MDM7272912.1 metallophosphoesterase [Sulfurihydrogenibium azorense]